MQDKGVGTSRDIPSKGARENKEALQHPKWAKGR